MAPTETTASMLARAFRDYADRLDGGGLVCNSATIELVTAAFYDTADEYPRAVQRVPTGARIVTAELVNPEERARCVATLARPSVVGVAK